MCLLAAWKRYTTKECEDEKQGKAKWSKALQTMWEYEIVAEEDIRAWHADERAAGRLQVSPVDAQDLREELALLRVAREGGVKLRVVSVE